jgi:hypothetical protein
MFKIERTPIGFRLTFAGKMSKEETEQWFKDSEKALASFQKPFVVIADKRALEPLPLDAQAEHMKGQRLFLDKGMQRVAVILADPVGALQSKRLAKQSGIFAVERYIDASSHANWEKIADDWVRKGIDPDK